MTPEKAREMRAVAASNATAATRAAIIAELNTRPLRGASTQHLTAKTGRSKTTVNRALRALINEGRVHVTPDPFDARIRRYHLSSPSLRYRRA